MKVLDALFKSAKIRNGKRFNFKNLGLLA